MSRKPRGCIERPRNTATHWGRPHLRSRAFAVSAYAQNRIDAYQWMSLAAAQGDEEARAYLPAIEGTLTLDELELAKADVAKFRPKERKGERRPSKKRTSETSSA